MRLFSRFIVLLIALWCVTGCVEVLDNKEYHVECTVDKSLGNDSVTLMLLDDAYERVWRVATVGVDSVSGAFVFDGHIEQPCVAYLKFANDSTPLMFVLEHGDSYISVAPHSLVVSAGNLNHDYMLYLKQRMAINAARKTVHNEYLQAAAPDSVISFEQERQFFVRDSLLVDSLERITLETINLGNPVSRIVFDRFVTSLRPSYLKQIKLE